MATEASIEFRIETLISLLGWARVKAEYIRGKSTNEHERIKADSIARQLRELVKETEEMGFEEKYPTPAASP